MSLLIPLPLAYLYFLIFKQRMHFTYVIITPKYGECIFCLFALRNTDTDFKLHDSFVVN